MTTRLLLLAGASVLLAPAASAEPGDPRMRVAKANTEARVQPDRQGYRNAIQQYAWVEGALFQIYSAPEQITDIVLQEGERLVGPGPIAAGDTARWLIGDTVSGAGASERVHILVKPTRTDISTNMIINTNRRTYYVELRATSGSYMASVSWTYPADELIALRAAEAEAARVAPIAGGIDIAALNFRYRIGGDKTEWRPLRVFDDGRQLYVEFAGDIGVREMPPLFVLGPRGEAELVNYRVHGRYMIVDRLFDRGELRLGAGKAARAVRIEREDMSRRGRS